MFRRFREWRQRRALDKDMAAKGYRRIEGATRGRIYEPVPGGLADNRDAGHTGPSVRAGATATMRMVVRDKDGNVKHTVVAPAQVEEVARG